MDVAVLVSRRIGEHRDRSHLAFVTAGAAGVTLVLIAALLGASAATDSPALSAVLRASMVAAPLAAGTYAWHLAPYERFARLLVLVGLASFVTTLAESGDATLYSTGRVAAWGSEILLVFLMLAFPSGRVDALADRALVLAMTAVVAAFYLPTVLLAETYRVPSPYTSCTSDCPDNAFFVLDAQPWLVDAALRPLGTILLIAVMVAVLLRLRERLHAASPMTRRVLMPLLVIAMLRTALISLGIVGRDLGEEGAVIEAASVTIAAATPAIALAFLVGIVRWRLYGELGLRRLVECVRTVPDAPALLRALGDALGDPSTEIVFPVRGRQHGWVDSAGRPVPPPGSGTGRAVHHVESDGAVVAAILHDARGAARPELTEVAASLAAVALENQRLIAEAEAATREALRSRARIAASADAERRRIERDLHDGAQQRLVALRIELGLAEELALTDPERCAARLQELEAAVEEALEELRALAHGVCPPLLSDRGLAEALGAAVARVAIAGQLHARDVGRYPPEIESAVYFCVLEALQNVAKHAAGARRVVVELDGQVPGQLRFVVRDDGAGALDGALHGAGITNMHDRVAAVGGELRISSRPNVGTEVRGRVPVLLQVYA